ncbi:hypothetical protein J4Q44_G00183020 [Coregonus suidteri]|uniref:E3 ubiquitin-protein ligase RNF216 UBA domain-containing protein n=1 Tax=Coregonus suidteri TaxID=861788 RepID=A0AAN8LKI4_9TELE
MADGTDDDDVIHLASFNIHRSQGRRHRRRTFITISDDSDEEPVTLVPNSPAHDDDVSILEPDDDDDDVVILERHHHHPIDVTVQRHHPIDVTVQRHHHHPIDVTVQRHHHPIQSCGTTPHPVPAQTIHLDLNTDQTSTPDQACPAGGQVSSAPSGPDPCPPTAAPSWTPQPAKAPAPPCQPHALLLTHAFQMQQPRALQPRPAPQRWPAGPLCRPCPPGAVDSCGPRASGPPETGHRITLGSQTPGGPNPQPRASLLAHDRPLSLEPQVALLSPKGSRGEGRSLLVLQEVQRPERPQLQPHVRAHWSEECICNVLLENPAFPQRQSSSSASQTSILLEPSFNNTQSAEDLFDYGSLGPVGPEVVMQAADLLMGDFRMISCQHIKWSLNAMKGHYAITRKALCEAVKQLQDSESLEKRKRRRHTGERCYIDFKFQHGSVKLEKRMYFLEKNRRGCRTYGAALDQSLQREITFYQQKAKEHAEHEDFLLALQVNEEEYEKVQLP